MTPPAGETTGRIAQADSAPIRVVFDTSVLLRYLIKPSAAIRELIETWWLDGRVQMITAPELLTKLADVLERPSIRRFVEPEEGQALVEIVTLLAETIPALGMIPAFGRDPKDDKFIACALTGSARFVITSDKDLLVIGEIGDVKMITPFQFLQLFNAQDS